MDRRSELGDFLRSRRARRQPEDLGLTPVGGRRRVPGLRREELAQAAALSVDYYVRLEQGRLRNPSKEIVDAVATALGLDESERRYLHNLARPRRDAQPATHAVPTTIQTLIDNTTVPAALYSRRGDVLAWNALTAALLVDFAQLPPDERNMHRLVFLNPEIAGRFVQWECKARDLVSQLRMEAGRNPGDERLATLVGELSMRSPEFARLWATHPVREKIRGGYRYRHPVVGEFYLRYEAFSLPGAPDLSLVCQVADPGSPDEEALRLLASWTARPDRVNAQLR
ncbi:helix-turn-helix transcriptional regulator [Actinophytocola sp.]|uniref:helix-turn-helix transcriptional regulator n=1 Tax=Actinophytocola sp. TaxID=1872138 RepID=UPI002D51A688|nr:helix-turn-helix transcriptional regulator [Actinophytocola sp.]HYQ63649.1 helix-turn-helix transcriptional regulator [Actinophytocola sp.]